MKIVMSDAPRPRPGTAFGTGVARGANAGAAAARTAAPGRRAEGRGCLPPDARLYLAHVEDGVGLRELARAEGCHASTILRRIRRTESRREDPLIDAALTRLASQAETDAPADIGPSNPEATSPKEAAMNALVCPPCADSDPLDAEARRLLRRLAEPGACLAVADGMEKAIIMRGAVRTAIVERAVAEAFALRDWIAAQPALDEAGQPLRSRIARYRLTAAGRSHLRGLLAESAAPQTGCLPRAGDFGTATPVGRAARSTGDEDGLAEAPAAFDIPAEGMAHKVWGSRVLADPEDGRRRRMRVNLAESPLTLLARRRDRNGAPFLSDDLVMAGERLREDFELAQIGPRVAQNWERFLTGAGDRGQFRDTTGTGGSERARERVAAALRDLGPGLGDMVLRVCCFLEGVEAAEQTLGWSARSGKIVLRIALLRLKRHYDETYGGQSMLIG